MTSCWRNDAHRIPLAHRPRRATVSFHTRATSALSRVSGLGCLILQSAQYCPLGDSFTTCGAGCDAARKELLKTDCGYFGCKKLCKMQYVVAVWGGYLTEPNNALARSQRAFAAFVCMRYSVNGKGAARPVPKPDASYAGTRTAQLVTKAAWLLDTGKTCNRDMCSIAYCLGAARPVHYRNIRQGQR
jgi:hypothetical protein